MFSSYHLVLPQLLVLTTGCVSFSTMHPADTLRPGRATFFVAGGYEQLGILFDEKEVDSQEVKQVESEVSFPVIEYGFRYGVVRDWEVGMKSSLFGSTTGDVKYRFLKQGAFTMATGLGLGYSDVVINSGAEDKDTESQSEFAKSVYELHLPLYTSYAVTKKFYLYTTPRYMHRSVSDEGASALAGLSLGTVFGSSIGVLLEYSTFKSLGERDRVQQFMAGLVFGFDNYHADRFDTDSETASSSH